MLDNWMKSIEDMYSYKFWKKEITKHNERILKFFKDAFDDVFSSKKKED